MRPSAKPRQYIEREKRKSSNRRAAISRTLTLCTPLSMMSASPLTLVSCLSSRASPARPAGAPGPARGPQKADCGTQGL